MAQRVIVHLGAPKTGTTYLQAVLFHNRETLRAAGVLVPGKNRNEHGLAATGVRQGTEGRRWPVWLRLVEEAAGWPGTVVISNEWFAMASTEQAARALAELGDTPVDLVFTARDFLEQVPAAWQETLKLGQSSSLEDFISGLEADSGRWRWTVLDPAEVLARWQGERPAEHAHVLTLPPKGAEKSPLWPRFADILGVDPQSCETDLDRARESLGVESARLLELIGPQLRQAVGADSPGQWEQAYRWIQRYLSHELLVPLGGRRIALSGTDAAEIRQRSTRSIKTLEAAGYRVAGHLDELVAAEIPPSARRPDEVPESELLEIAGQLISALLARVSTDQGDARLGAGSTEGGRDL